MAELICPGCKADIPPGEQYCRSACFLTPITKPGPAASVTGEPSCDDPDCPFGGQAPAAGCRACGEVTTAVTTLRFDWGTITVEPARPLLVGRVDSPIADRLDAYSNVSRRHAEIRSDGTGLTVVDLGSMNGTFVNDRRLPSGEVTEVHDGDRVRFAARLEATVTSAAPGGTP